MASLGFRFKHFVKRHERWFTFAGAFIVFMTFVIKEQLGERWRGISDTLDNARHMYELQKGSSETQAQIDALLHIIQTRKALAESVPEDIPEGAPRLSYDEPTYFTWYHDSLIEVQDTLHNVSIVTDKMPHELKRIFLARFSIVFVFAFSEAPAINGERYQALFNADRSVGWLGINT